MPQIKLTKHAIDKIPLATSTPVFYRDTEMRGFGIKIGLQSKSFFCEKKINGKVTRVKLGSYPILSVELARRMAQETIIKLLSGIDVNEEKASARVKQMTLAQVYVDFKESRSLTKKTLSGYDSVMRLYYGDWLELGISEITKDMVADRHSKLTIERGKASANQAARTLRSIINFAIGNYDLSNGKSLLTENPFDRLSKTGKWHRNKRKIEHLKPHQFSALFDEIDKVKNKVVADYILFVLFTGCRRSEVAALKWEDVNLVNKSFYVKGEGGDGPKNHNIIELPLTDYLMEIIERRARHRINDCVFPSARSKSGHIEEPKKVVAQIGEAIGYHFTIHDLRRTYITAAESIDTQPYVLKALVNHKLGGNSDVTAGYIQMAVERLREPMQRITDFIVGSAAG